jgi:hypothetical protein
MKRSYKDHARDNEGNISTITVYSTSPAGSLFNHVRNCVKCEATFPLEACTNCGGIEFGFCKISGRGDGIYCTRCDLGISRWTCPKCECSNSYAKSIVTFYTEDDSELSTPPSSQGCMLCILVPITAFFVFHLYRCYY